MEGGLPFLGQFFVFRIKLLDCKFDVLSSFKSVIQRYSKRNLKYNSKHQLVQRTIKTSERRQWSRSDSLL